MSHTGRIEQIRNMLLKEPEDIFLNYALALELAKNNNSLNMAEQQFKKVLALNKDYIPAYYQLGKLYEEMSDNNLALSTYTIGLQKARDQKNNKAINELGEAIFLLED